MPKVLVLYCSPHGSSALAQAIVREAIANLRTAVPRLAVVERNLAESVPSQIGGAYASAITAGEPNTTPVFEESETLVCELEDCDYLVVATPMHNFTVPAALKLWIDHAVRAGRTFHRRVRHQARAASGQACACGGLVWRVSPRRERPAAGLPVAVSFACAANDWHKGRAVHLFAGNCATGSACEHPSGSARPTQGGSFLRDEGCGELISCARRPARGRVSRHGKEHGQPNGRA